MNHETREIHEDIIKDFQNSEVFKTSEFFSCLSCVSWLP